MERQEPGMLLGAVLMLLLQLVKLFVAMWMIQRNLSEPLPLLSVRERTATAAP